MHDQNLRALSSCWQHVTGDIVKESLVDAKVEMYLMDAGRLQFVDAQPWHHNAIMKANFVSDHLVTCYGSGLLSGQLLQPQSQSLQG